MKIDLAMNDKNDFREKSDNLIKYFEEQVRVLTNYLETLEKEYHLKIDSEKDTREARIIDNKNNNGKKKL